MFIEWITEQTTFKAGFHGTICRPDGVGAQILRVFLQPMNDRFMKMKIGPICCSAKDFFLIRPTLWEKPPCQSMGMWVGNAHEY